jgi:hypothetical protein
VIERGPFGTPPTMRRQVELLARAARRLRFKAIATVFSLGTAPDAAAYADLLPVMRRAKECAEEIEVRLLAELEARR